MSKTYIIYFGNQSYESKPNESLKDALIGVADHQDACEDGRQNLTEIIYLTSGREIVLTPKRLNAAIRYYESLFDGGYYSEHSRSLTGKPIYNVL